MFRYIPCKIVNIHIYSIFVLFIFSSINISAQSIIQGRILDNSSNSPLQFATVTVSNFDKSLSVSTMSDSVGFFKLKIDFYETCKISFNTAFYNDTNIVILFSHDSTTINLGDIKLRSKIITLKDITISDIRNNINYDGDTLNYRVSQSENKSDNDFIELIKNIPGIIIDANNNIYFENNNISEVLIDGDNLFYNDINLATKYINVKNIDAVQIYPDNKSNLEFESPNASSVLNFKLKDEFQNSNFGKLESSSNFKNVNCNNISMNSNKVSRKLFIASYLGNKFYSSQSGVQNIPNASSNSSSNPINKYYFNYCLFYTNTFKNGFKLNVNNNYEAQNSLYNRYSRNIYSSFDSIYASSQNYEVNILSKMKNISILLEKQINKFALFSISHSLNLNDINQNIIAEDTFMRSPISIYRITMNDNHMVNKFLNMKSSISLSNNKIKGVNNYLFRYDLSLTKNNINNTLNSEDSYSNNIARMNNESLNKQSKYDNYLIANYRLHINKQLVLESTYELRSIIVENSINNSIINENKSNVYNNLINDLSFTNWISHIGGKIIYSRDKYILTLGSYYRNILYDYSNYSKENIPDIKYNNILPLLSILYKMDKCSSVELSYNSKIQLPTISQVLNNYDMEDINNVRIGNYSLKPTYSNLFNATYKKYNPKSNQNIFSRILFILPNNAFTQLLEFDSLKHSTSQTVNINGNIICNGYILMSIPINSKIFTLSTNVNFNYTKANNYIAKKKYNNINNIYLIGVNIKMKVKTFSISDDIIYSYNKNVYRSVMENIYSYSTYNSNIEISLQLPFKFKINNRINYALYSYETNLKTIIWNASICKTLLRKSNMLISLEGFDLLSQNNLNSRGLMNNVLTYVNERSTNQYVLLKVIYNFNIFNN